MSEQQVKPKTLTEMMEESVGFYWYEGSKAVPRRAEYKRFVTYCYHPEDFLQGSDMVSDAHFVASVKRTHMSLFGRDRWIYRAFSNVDRYNYDMVREFLPFFFLSRNPLVYLYLAMLHDRWDSDYTIRPRELSEDFIKRAVSEDLVPSKNGKVAKSTIKNLATQLHLLAEEMKFVRGKDSQGRWSWHPPIVHGDTLYLVLWWLRQSGLTFLKVCDLHLWRVLGVSEYALNKGLGQLFGRFGGYYARAGSVVDLDFGFDVGRLALGVPTGKREENQVRVPQTIFRDICPVCMLQEQLDEKGNLVEHSIWLGLGEKPSCPGSGLRPASVDIPLLRRMQQACAVNRRIPPHRQHEGKYSIYTRAEEKRARFLKTLAVESKLKKMSQSDILRVYGTRVYGD